MYQAKIHKQISIIPGMLPAGDLDPSGEPAATMHTLEEIFRVVTPPLPTGFVLWKGNTRFAVNDVDCLVLDRATGLMWKDVNSAGPKPWTDAVDYCDSLRHGDRFDWRLPAVEELKSLLEPYPSPRNPALPEGHPFVNVQSGYFWSSTTYEGNSGYAWDVSMISGYVDKNVKTAYKYVWPVRGGN